MGVIIHSRFTGEHTREHFFSTDHCQGLQGGEYPEGFVPCSHYLPSKVVPRPALPSGRIATLADLLAIFYADSVRIDNPDPRFAVYESDEEYRNRIALTLADGSSFSLQDLSDASGSFLDELGEYYNLSRKEL